MMRAHRLLRTGFVTLGVLVGGLGFSASAALAAPHRVFSGSLEVPSGGLNGPLGLAAGPKGELFVANSSSKVVDVYKPGSTPEVVSEFSVPGQIELYQLAVDDATATASEVDVYVANLESVIEYAYDPQTKTETEVRTITEGLNEPASVATGPEGDVYVGSFVGGEPGKGYVNKYSATGTPIASELVKGLTGPESIAVDSAGNIYVASGVGALKCSNTGSCAAFGGAEVAKPDNGVTIGPEGDVYIGVEGASAGANFVFVFESNGTLVEGFGAEHSIGAPWGIGVVGASVYVTNHAGEVAEFAVPQPLSAKTEPPSEVSKTTAKLHGKVALEGGGKIKYHFDYEKTGGLVSETPGAEVTVTSGSDEAEVSAEITGLEADTTYRYKIVATDTKPEAAEGKDETFGLLAPLVEAASAPYVGVFEAKIEAQVNPENLATTCLVEYGTEPLLKAGTTTPAPCEQASLTGGPQSASMHLAGLTPGTTYYYRVVAENAIGTSGPSEGTGELTSAAAVAPVFEGESVSGESEAVPGQEEVTFSGQVNPELQLTSACAFEYGKLGDPSYEASVPCEQSSQQIGNGSASVSVEAKVGGLQAGSDYHYRFVVKNETGSAEGPDQVFGPPTVVTGAVLSPTPGIAPGTTATVGGEVNPEGVDTHYYVQYGSEGEEYSHSAPFLPLGVPLPQGIDAGSGSTPVVLGGAGAPPEVSLEGLAAGGVYHYRLVAYNADGTTYGAAQTVTVLPAPVVGPASVSEITQGSATITTSVNPEGLHTLYELDVGTSTAYGTPYPGDAGSGSGPVLLAFHLSGLHAGDTYHFRLTASNSNGTSTEADQTFTTVPGPQGFVPAFTVTPSLPPLAFTAVAFPAEGGTTGTGPTSKGLTRAQKLKDALKQCKKDKSKSKRMACEKAAKKKYGATAKKKK
jgi:hypothetical protein